MSASLSMLTLCSMGKERKLYDDKQLICCYFSKGIFCTNIACRMLSRISRLAVHTVCVSSWFVCALLMFYVSCFAFDVSVIKKFPQEGLMKYNYS